MRRRGRSAGLVGLGSLAAVLAVEGLWATLLGRIPVPPAWGMPLVTIGFVTQAVAGGYLVIAGTEASRSRDMAPAWFWLPPALLIIASTLGEYRALETPSTGAAIALGDVVLGSGTACAVVMAIAIDTAVRAVRRASRVAELAAIVAQSPDGILSLSLDATIRSWNAGAEAILGHAQPDIVGRPVWLLAPPETRHETMEVIEHARGGQSVSGFETRWIAKSGASIDVSLCVSPFTVRTGDSLGIAVIVRDVTERKRLEAHLRQAQKLEAIGRLTGGVVHDFNNVLTAIIGSCELLSRDVEASPSALTRVRDIHTAGTLASDLTRQLLAFSRSQRLQPSRVDLVAFVRRLQPLLSRVIREDVAVELDLPDGTLPVRVDPGQLTQVILNLVTNARDAMPDGGRLHLAVAREISTDASPVAVGVPPGAFACLSVSDTGVGMSTATLARVFDPFYTTKAPDRGTGLGLSTVHGVVTQSQGYLSVESTQGVGTTFRVFLPLETRTSAEPGTLDRQPSADRPRPGTGTTVLVVEDDAGVRTVTAEMLRRRGYLVIEAASAAEALAASAGHSAPIQILLTDIVLPGISGPTLASELSESHPGIGVLLMSGYPDHGSAATPGAGPGFDFLPKPFGEAELAAAVGRLTGRADGRTVLAPRSAPSASITPPREDAPA